MTFFQSTKRKKISIRLNPIDVAARAFKSLALPAIKTIEHEDEKVICLYIDA